MVHDCSTKQVMFYLGVFISSMINQKVMDETSLNFLKIWARKRLDFGGNPDPGLCFKLLNSSWKSHYFGWCIAVGKTTTGNPNAGLYLTCMFIISGGSLSDSCLVQIIGCFVFLENFLGKISKAVFDAVLRVGRYGPVSYTVTSLADLKPYLHFILTTAILVPHKETVLLPPNVFSALKISHTCVCGRAPDTLGELTALPRLPTWLGEWEGRDGSGMGEGRERKGQGNRSIPVSHTSFPNFEAWFDGL